MALLQDWREYAYSRRDAKFKRRQKNSGRNYFTLKNGIYEKLLSNPGWR